MPDTASLLTFTIAATVLIIIPGPAVLYIVARSIEQGRLAGLASVLGVAAGTLVHSVAAAAGLSALILTSALAFSIVKYLGALYLIYLGITTLLRKPAATPIRVDPPRPLGHIFRQGLVVNVLNPKAALFFLAFLPQFADPGRGSVPVQILLLGLLFATIALFSDSVYALLAGQLSRWLMQNVTFQRRRQAFSGTVYILLGITTALYGRSTSK